MATPPTFGTETETVWNASTTPKTAAVAVGVGDVLVVIAATADSATTLATPTGGGLTYTLAQSIVTANYCSTYVWTAVSPSSQSFSVSVSSGGVSNHWGLNVLQFTGSSGVGASNKTNVTTGAPSLSLTTGSANSAIVVVSSDWTATDGTVRTWRTVNSVTPTAGNGGERTYNLDSGQYTVYGGYWSDAGAAGAKTVGLSAPSGQAYAIIAVEVKGTGSGSTQNADATLTATGTVVSTADATHPAASTLTAASTTASAATAVRPATTTSTTTAVVTAAGAATRPADSSTTATATVTTTGVAVRPAGSTTTATAAITGAATAVHPASATVSTTATITATATVTSANGVDAAVTAIATIATAATTARTAGSTATATATVSTTAKASRSASASLTSTATITATATVTGAVDDGPDADYVIGAPQTAWHVGPPRTGWSIDLPHMTWTVGRPR